MKKFRSIILIAVSSLMLAAVLAGCGSTGQTGTATESTSGSAPSKGKLVMATSADYKPYEFHDLTSGKDEIVGFDVDIAKYAAKELGFELVINDMNFDGLIPALQSNRADFVMAGMTPKPERLKNADFSVIYFESKNSLVAKKESNITRVEDLAGKKVVVQTGSIQEEYAKEIAKTVKDLQIISLNKIGEMVQEVKTGRIDAAIIEDTVAKGFVEQNQELQYTTVQTDGSNGSAVAFPKGSKHVEEFNQIIKKMQENGEMDKLIKKWFGQ